MPPQPPVTPAALEKTAADGFSLIPDLQERLTAIVHSCAGQGIPEDDRRDADLVPGCVSRVWLNGGVENGALQLRWDADSPLVRGLAGLLCGVYGGADAEAVAAHRSSILSALGLDRQLSPTRLRGLAAVEARIHALSAAPRPSPCG